MQINQRFDPTQGCCPLDCLQEQTAFFFVIDGGEYVFEQQAAFCQRCGQLLALQVLPYQISQREEMTTYLSFDQVTGLLITHAFEFCQIFAQVRSPSFQILDQERISLDTGHDARHHQITKQTEQAGHDHRVKPEHQRRGQQAATMTTTVYQEDDARECPKIDVRQQPVTQS